MVLPFMILDTKIALIIRSDLEVWQKLNVSSFLASGIAAEFPSCIGAPYEDGSGTKYTQFIGQPILIYGTDSVGLARALDRALTRDVKPAVFTNDMFTTMNDIENHKVVKSVERESLDLVGIAVRAERKIIDKIVDKLNFLK
jgi:hypothetical protein